MDAPESFLHYLSTLAPLSPGLAKQLMQQISLVHLGPGDIYFHKDQVSQKLAFLAQGIMRIYNLDEKGHEWNKVFLSPPSLVLGNANYRQKSIHYVGAITACICCQIPISLLEDLLDAYPELQQIQIKLLTQLYQTKEQREYDFQTLTAKERYLKWIGEQGHLRDEIPQFHLASYLGITPTQLSRIRQSLPDQHM